MNCAGEISPCSGLVQRSSASTPVMRAWDSDSLGW
jgi:hypothetical protein